MFHSWRCALKATRDATRLLVTSDEGDVMKARLTPGPSHPRALITLLEGVSLWRGQPPLRIALSAAADCPRWPDSTLFGDELWPAESPLLQFEFVSRVRRRVRLEGVCDFRQERGASSKRGA